MNKKLLRLCAGIIGLSGFVIFFSTIYPIIEYELKARQEFPILISSRVEENNSLSRLTTSQDYTKASNWFPDKRESSEYIDNTIGEFSLSVPKLNIRGARVTVSGEDLSKSLIQYQGTALPGQVGNSVIFGHSVLPTYFDPNNYMAIFSTLHELDKGDLFQATYDNITYTYEVESMFEVRPTDLWILEQTQSESYLSLVTCSPPGDPRKPKRLVVRAKLLPANQQANANISN